MAKDGTNRGGAWPGAGRPRKNPEGTTEHATFTAEQLKELVDLPYVASVSSKSVSYTKEYKEIVWKEYCNGIDPMEIFANHGFNTEVLGRSRIMGFIKSLREAKEKGLKFTEGNEPYPTDAEKKYMFPAPPKLPKRGSLKNHLFHGSNTVSVGFENPRSDIFQRPYSVDKFKLLCMTSAKEKGFISRSAVVLHVVENLTLFFDQSFILWFTDTCRNYFCSVILGKLTVTFIQLCFIARFDVTPVLRLSGTRILVTPSKYL